MSYVPIAWNCPSIGSADAGILSHPHWQEPEEHSGEDSEKTIEPYPLGDQDGATLPDQLPKTNSHGIKRRKKTKRT